MANNYTELSCKLELEENQIEQAQSIVDRVCEEIENDPEEGYMGIEIMVKSDGIWFFSEEDGNPDTVERMVKALLEELEIDEPFCFSWSHTCSKPRLDEFGGGACSVKRGHESYWVDALSHVMNHKF